MSAESWYKISLPAFPVAFTVFGVWLYWGENPLPLLPPSISFWGLMILFYLFTHLYVPNRMYPLLLTIFGTALWMVASITSHKFGKFLTSERYSGFLSILLNKDFWYAYICAGVVCAVGLRDFFRFESLILAKSQEDRDAIEPEE